MESENNQEQLRGQIKDQVQARLINLWQQTLNEASELKTMLNELVRDSGNNEQILGLITSLQPPIHNLQNRQGEEFPWVPLISEGINAPPKGSKVDSLLKLCTDLIGKNDHLQDLAQAAIRADEEKFRAREMAAYSNNTEGPIRPPYTKISVPIDEATGLTADLRIGLHAEATLGKPMYQIEYVDVLAPTHLEKDDKVVNSAAEMVGGAVRLALFNN